MSSAKEQMLSQYDEIQALKAENERLTKKSDSSDEYIDILQGRCYRINNQYCRWKHQKKRLPWDRMISMEEIDERLKMDDNIDLTLAPLFKIMKHFMEENEQLKAENEKLKAENEKLKAKNEHEKEAVREYHKLHVADTYICGNGICKGKTYEEAKRIIIDKEGYEYWELWRKRVTWGLV